MKGWWKVFVLGIIGSLVVQTVCGAVALKKEMTGDAFFDPAHTVVEVTLVPRIFYADYLKAHPPLPAPVPMRSMALPAVVTHLTLLGIENGTNGAVSVQVGWPTGFTNRVEIYQTSNLLASNWTFSRTNIITVGSSSFTWVDESATNQIKRFYVAGNADIDDDHDGLVDARELFIYKTDRFLFDTDGDGLGDGWEILYGFSPLWASSSQTLGDADGDGFSNLEEQKKGTDPTVADVSGSTGIVTTVRYYYDDDDRLTDFYAGATSVQKTIFDRVDNVKEEVSTK